MTQDLCRNDGGRLAGRRYRAGAAGRLYVDGYGANVPGSGKCPTYKMVIDVTVDGETVKGRFQQEGRPERSFEAKLGENGAIKTAAMVGGGGMMDVIGQIKEGDSRIKLDGYCVFEGKLTKK